MKQECIPVGCVPPARNRMAGLPDRDPPGHTPSPVNRITDRCKNITCRYFVAGGNNRLAHSLGSWHPLWEIVDLPLLRTVTVNGSTTLQLVICNIDKKLRQTNGSGTSTHPYQCEPRNPRMTRSKNLEVGNQPI